MLFKQNREMPIENKEFVITVHNSFELKLLNFRLIFLIYAQITPFSNHSFLHYNLKNSNWKVIGRKLLFFVNEK